MGQPAPEADDEAATEYEHEHGHETEPGARTGGAQTVYLGLGSNLGDRPANLRAALDALTPDPRVLQVSSVYETAPLHVIDQPAFYNLVCRAQTLMPPLALLRRLKQIERDLGRTPGRRYGPRLIDLDVLLYDDLALESSELTLPHPRMLERAFVLVPLAEIAGELRLPASGETVAALAARLPAAGVRCIGPLFGRPG